MWPLASANDHDHCSKYIAFHSMSWPVYSAIQECSETLDCSTDAAIQSTNTWRWREKCTCNREWFVYKNNACEATLHRLNTTCKPPTLSECKSFARYLCLFIWSLSGDCVNRYLYFQTDTMFTLAWIVYCISSYNLKLLFFVHRCKT